MEFYLIPDDYTLLVRQADFEALGGNNPYNLQRAEATALAEVARELAAFDTTKALRLFTEPDPGQAYPAGARLLSPETGMLFATQDVPAGTLAEPNDYWQAGDTRPVELVQVVGRLTIFHLASRLAEGSQHPALAAQAGQARQWLRDQAAGTAQALLPRLAEARPRFGSAPRQFSGRSMWS